MAGTGDPNHPTARAVRAARAYSGMSRKQLGDLLELHPGTIGRWERGEWDDEPPKKPMLEVVARVSGLLELVEAMAADLEPDPARRFAAAARREAQRRNGRPSSGPASRPDEDVGGGAR